MEKIQRRSRIFFSISILLMTSLVYQNCDVIDTESLVAIYKGNNEAQTTEVMSDSLTPLPLATSGPTASRVTLSNSNPLYNVEQSIGSRHFFKLENCRESGELIDLDQNTSFYVEESLNLRLNGSFGGGIVSTTVDILNLQ